ncbi:hypothetical protein SCP_0601290 [Sparassis crispa]|uniref:Uncharacterized protein n=1 Tax=Sparassis crispa TaxID=139825 RepID=A0A401GPI7_9APHY|nr:hypothetical protein SCP_0601290 [Sparassis crispa]GBE84151.1 hypothetical protein SCP_0601290 [Sparassis crispa]
MSKFAQDEDLSARFAEAGLIEEVAKLSEVKGRVARAVADIHDGHYQQLSFRSNSALVIRTPDERTTTHNAFTSRRRRWIARAAYWNTRGTGTAVHTIPFHRPNSSTRAGAHHPPSRVLDAERARTDSAVLMGRGKQWSLQRAASFPCGASPV